ncbi:MAG: serine/threonine protein kinase [Acidobacteriia bacterium]|nr:serine/threonine protein kinase [Terriglobia bacterium]
MAEHRWPEINRIVGEALELPENERRAYIENARLPDDMQQRVVSLLDACQRSDGYLENPPLPLEFEHPPATARIGSLCGHWRLKAAVGSGGMGTVYRAYRDDQQFSQLAAVKVIAPGCVSATLERRFREEREILARLEHPNIARLIDGGVASDGAPYLAMEYVDGSPVDAWCRDHSCDTRARLRLFVQVCDAVAFAHRNLVVHCDIKPSNILVTEDGTPKLLDFGIARLLERNEAITATLLKPLTPDYASPEQIRGLPLSTATDIYSLGVLLYELLTSRRPYQLGQKTLDQVLAIICERQPDAPRTGAPDLDAVVLKALRKEPSERYASAGEFAADVRRYLEGLPVQAQPPSKAYVFRKFVARHRVAVAAGAIAMLLTIAAGAVIFEESQVSARRFDQVRQLAHFMIFDMHDAVSPLPGSTPVRKLLASRGLEYLDNLAASAAGDENLQRELGLAYTRLGDVSGLPSEPNLGDSASAIASYQKALSLLEPLYARHPQDVALAHSVARVYQDLNAVYDVNLHQLGEGRAAAEKVLRIDQALTRLSPGDKTREGLAIAYFSLANADSEIGRKSGSQHEFQLATDIFEELLSHQPQNPERQRNAALGHKSLFTFCIEAHDPKTAEAHLSRAEQLDQSRVRADPSNRQARLDLSFDYSEYGTLYADAAHDNATALTFFEKALAIREDLSSSDPSDVRLLDRSGWLHRTLAQTLLSLNRLGEARGHAEQAAKIADELRVGAATPHNREMLAMAHDTWAEIEAAGVNPAAACMHWRKARDLLQSLRSDEMNQMWSDELKQVTQHVHACRSDK